jgi:hypothetical protein
MPAFFPGTKHNNQHNNLLENKILSSLLYCDSFRAPLSVLTIFLLGYLYRYRSTSVFARTSR